VIDTMGDAYAELRQRARHVVDTTRVEEQGFLATIEGGMARFDQIAPARTTQGSTELRGTISGEDAFRLYDTYGFPLDLTELMARERGYTVDVDGFERALAAQRARSQEERRSRRLGVAVDELADLNQWERAPQAGSDHVAFVGYERVDIDTQVTAVKHLDGQRVAILLRETPFYAESGGQIADRGEIVGEGWRLDVEDVKKIDGRPAAVGTLKGAFQFGRVRASVPAERRRDTERNHTATHLLHAALRRVLGDAVHQAGSLVAPDRLRFDFTHHGPVLPPLVQEIEELVNQWIWRGAPVTAEEVPYAEARARGAMALFGEKYGDVVRVVTIPGFSMELCGGTHVRNTAEIGLFKVIAETGVAAGVRRIEAVTGPAAFAVLRDRDRALSRLAELLKTPVENVERRVQALIEERRGFERRLEEAVRGGGGDRVQELVAAATKVDSTRVVAVAVSVGDVRELQSLGDALRERLGSGVGVLAASFSDGRNTLLAVVTDDLRERGVSADTLVRHLAAAAGGRGGGKAHMAQAGIPDAARLPEALSQVPGAVRRLLGLNA
jgi:alanyl-tRNA synthetase